MSGKTQGQPCEGGFGKKNPATLDPIFRPRSIAVIGASTRRGAIGREIVHNLISGDFQGKLFPVNPQGGVHPLDQGLPLDPGGARRGGPGDHRRPRGGGAGGGR